MKQRAKKIASYTAAILIALYALAVFRKSLTSGLAHLGALDFYIFLNHAHLFLDQGMIYLRNLSLYGPGEPIYKFPPLYGALLVEALRAGAPEEGLYFHAWALQAISLVGGILLCLHAKTGKTTQKNLPLTVACVFAFALGNGFFIDNAYRLQLEPYVFFLMSAGLFLLSRNTPVGAGFFIAVAVTLKIYPGLLLLHSLFLRQRWRLAMGAVAGGAVTLAVSLWLLNLDEHVFYAIYIIPRLLTEYIYHASENLSIGHMVSPLFPSSETPKTINNAVFILALLLWLAPMCRHALRQSDAHRNDITAVDNDTIAVDFSALFMVMLIGMPNFWWNYQLLNLLPAIVAIRIIADMVITEKPRAYAFPMAALTVSFILQNIMTTAPYFWPAFQTALTSLGDPVYIVLRCSIQISLFLAVLLLQWKAHQHSNHH